MEPNTTATASTLYATACWLIERQRHDDAKHVFRTMLVVVPADTRAWLGLGACHEHDGDIEKAAELYDLAERACGPTARCLIAKARLQRAAGYEDEARASYREAALLSNESDDLEALAIAHSEGCS